MKIFLTLLTLASLSSCAFLKDIKGRIVSFDFEKNIPIGTNEDHVLKEAGEYRNRVVDGKKEILLFRTGYVVLSDNKVTRRGSYENSYDTQLPFSSNIRNYSDLFEVFINFGNPASIMNQSALTTVYYNNGALISDGHNILKSIDKRYTADLVFYLNINGFSDYSAKNKGSYLLMPGDKDISPEDLQFKEVKRYLEITLVKEGFSITSDPMNADYIALVKYGVSDPKEDIKVISRPVFIPTYLPGATTNFYSGYKFIGSAQTSGRWGSQYAGQNTETIKTVTFNRWLNVEAVDNSVLKSKKFLKPVWKILVNSTGATSDFRFVMPALTYGAGSYINQDTQRRLSFEVSSGVLNRYIYESNLSNMKTERGLAGE